MVELLYSPLPRAPFVSAPEYSSMSSKLLDGFRITVIVMLTWCTILYAQNSSPPDTTTLQKFNNTLINNIPYDVAELAICESPRRCVAHYNCLKNESYNIYGVGLISAPIGLDDNWNKLKVKEYEYQVSADNAIIQKNGVEAKVCHYLETCCMVKSTDDRPGSGKPVPLPTPVTTGKGCGFRNPNGIYFEIKSSDHSKAQYGEFPWMVAILSNHSTYDQPLCGGSLIHPSVILTAAHCVSKHSPHEYRVRAGEWDTQTKIENLPHQEHNVREILIHEDFWEPALIYDFALVIVDRPFQLTESVQPVCLPTTNLLFDNETDCYATGWGKDKFSKLGRRQSILKKVKLPVHEHEKCQNMFRQTRLGDMFEFDRTFMCAGGIAGEDVCTGDGGSPLVCPVYDQPNRYYQTGIVAWGLGCGDGGVPGAYANVGIVRGWIDNKMIQAGFGTSTYSVN